MCVCDDGSVLACECVGTEVGFCGRCCVIAYAPLFVGLSVYVEGGLCSLGEFVRVAVLTGWGLIA